MALAYACTNNICVLQGKSENSSRGLSVTVETQTCRVALYYLTQAYPSPNGAVHLSMDHCHD